MGLPSGMLKRFLMFCSSTRTRISRGADKCMDFKKIESGDVAVITITACNGRHINVKYSQFPFKLYMDLFLFGRECRRHAMVTVVAADTRKWLKVHFSDLFADHSRQCSLLLHSSLFFFLKKKYSAGLVRVNRMKEVVVKEENIPVHQIARMREGVVAFRSPFG